MTNILFVCLGNICRSPMAEYIMKHLVAEAGRSEAYYIESAATSREEIGNDVYPPARRKLTAEGVPCPRRAARQVTAADYDRFDLIICMDHSNIRNIRRIIPADPDGKISLLLDHCDRTPGTEVADPWYTGNFDATYRDCLEGCQALLEETANEWPWE